MYNERYFSVAPAVGGFILTTFDERSEGSTEVFTSTGKLLKRVKEVVEQLSKPTDKFEATLAK